MRLTQEEIEMRDGAQGPAVQAAMNLLIRYADALGAEEFIEVSNVSLMMTQPSPVRLDLVEEGGWQKAFAVTNLDSDDIFDIPGVRVPTCQVQQGYGRDALQITPYSRELVEAQEDAEMFVSERGVRVLGTCAPYQVELEPKFGEHCAWMESSAVVYANSVLGARTNCEGSASAGAASLTGRVPAWGLHHDVNRKADYRVRIETEISSHEDWGVLGYAVGDLVGESIPALISQRPFEFTPHDLKHFGAAAASSGGVEMFHLVGYTPEAPTLAACGGTGNIEEIVITRNTLDHYYNVLNDQGSETKVDFIMLGCPHASREQLQEIVHLLRGKRIHDEVEFWIHTPRDLMLEALRTGLYHELTASGVRILTDSCPAMTKTVPPGTRVFASDSAKQVHYLPAIMGIQGWFGSTYDCVQAGVTGEWRV